MKPFTGELNRNSADVQLALVRKAEMVMVSGLTAGLAGAIGGALSTELVPADVALSKSVNVEASFNLGGEGLILQNKNDELNLPNAPLSTHLPGFEGVKLRLKDRSVVKEVNQVIDDPQHNKPASFEQFTTLAARPDAAIVQPVKDALTARVAEGALAAPLVLIAGAVAIKRLRPFTKLGNMLGRFSPERNLSLPKGAVAALGTLAVAGCGVGGNVIIQNIDSAGSSLPAQIAKRSPYLKNATIKGDDIKRLANQIVGTLDEGQSAWQKIDANLEAKLDQYASKGGLSYIGNDKIVSELNETGVLCNQPFLTIVEPTLQSRLQPPITEDSGDRFTSGDTWGYESKCETDLLKPITNAKSILIAGIGNHDGEPLSTDLNPRDNFTKTVGGVTYVTYPDPRSNRWGHPNKALSQTALNKLIGQQGSILAEKACAIMDKTGVPPNVVVHTPEAGFETELRGCAQSVSSGHGVQPGDGKNTNRPTLTNYRADNGNVVQQLINVTASGAADTSSFYNKPGRDGAVVLKQYFRTGHKFISATSIIFKKDLSVEIHEMKNPEAIPPTQFMRQFVSTNSPTANMLRVPNYKGPN